MADELKPGEAFLHPAPDDTPPQCTPNSTASSGPPTACNAPAGQGTA